MFLFCKTKVQESKLRKTKYYINIFKPFHYYFLNFLRNGTTTTYAYNQANLVTSVLNKKGNTTLSSHSYIYYLDGNIASENENGTSKTYEYDGLGRLTKETKNDTIEYTYDANGNRATMTQNDVSVYIRGINLIYADDGDKTYYHFNAHGDVVALTNSNGSKTKSYSYNAFGVEYNESTLDDNPFRYCGEYYDKETQTIYLRARYYNVAQGRFTQEDPIRDGFNWYAYCGGNPVNFIDPRGTDTLAIPWRESLEAIIAAALLEPTLIGEIIAAVGIVTFLITAALIAEDTIDSGTMSGTDSKVDTDVEVDAKTEVETNSDNSSAVYYGAHYYGTNGQKKSGLKRLRQ